MAQEHIDEAVDWSIANGSVVYFIVRGSQVKVGTTRNLAKRLSELQCGSPDEFAPEIRAFAKKHRSQRFIDRERR